MTTAHYGRDRLKRSLAHFMMGKLVGLCIGLGWMLLSVRVLSAEHYGVYVAFSGLSELLTLSLGFGLFAVVERYVPEMRLAGQVGSLRRLVLQALLLRVAALGLGCGAVAMAAPGILQALELRGHETALRWFLVSVIAEGVGRYAETVFNSLLLQSHSQVSILLRYGSRTAMMAWYWAGGEPVSLEAWCLIEAVCSVSSVVVSLLLLARTVGSERSEAQTTAKLDWSRYMAFALPVFADELVLLFSSIDVAKLIVVRLFGPEVAALAGFCINLGWMLLRYLPTFLLIGMLRPLFVAAVHGAEPQARLKLLLGMLVKLNLFVMVPVIVVAAVHGDLLVAALSADRFPEGRTLLALLLLMVLTQAVRMSLAIVATVYEDGRGRLLSSLAGNGVFALGVVAAAVLDRPWVLVAALVLADVAACATLVRRVQSRGLTLEWPWAALIRTGMAAAAAAGVMAFTLHQVDGSTMYTIAAGTGGAVLCYLALTAALKPFSAQENATINSLLPRRIFVW